MATILRAIISTGNVANGAQAVLNHTLNIDDRGIVPDEVSFDVGGFVVIAATATQVTVQNNGPAATANMLAESWYSPERAFGSSATTALVPRPFTPASGAAPAGQTDTLVYLGGGIAPLNGDPFDLVFESAAPSINIGHRPFDLELFAIGFNLDAVNGGNLQLATVLGIFNFAGGLGQGVSAVAPVTLGAAVSFGGQISIPAGPADRFASFWFYFRRV